MFNYNQLVFLYENHIMMFTFAFPLLYTLIFVISCLQLGIFLIFCFLFASFVILF